MSLAPRLLLLAIMVLMADAKVSWADAAAPPLVTVQTHDGQTQQGMVDARTNDEALWLRLDEANISLATSTAWESISTAMVNGEAIQATNLRARLSPLVSARPALDVLLGGVASETLSYPQPGTLPTESQRIAAVSVTACLANWDADARADGVELLVVATDRNGVAWPVGGNLTVRLLGPRQTSLYRSEVRELGRWSEVVKPQHFGPAGESARYRLSYRGLEPETDSTIGDISFVEATLGVYGQGNFSARAPVVLQPHPAAFDRLDLPTGRPRLRSSGPWRNW